jgi:hypothetical protein
MALSLTKSKAGGLSLGDVLKTPKPKAAKLSTYEVTRRGNARNLSQLKAQGASPDVGAPDPSLLDRIFGALGTPGLIIKGAVHNTILDPGNPIDPFKSLDKQLANKPTGLEAGTILKEHFGVKNKWGQMFGGLAIDILADPITYASFGYGSATKASAKSALALGAEYGFDAARMLEAAAASSDDIGRAANLTRAAEIISRSNIPAEIAAQSFADLPRAASHALWQDVLRGAGSLMDDSGGIKFMGQTVVKSAQPVFDKATALASEATAHSGALGKMFDVNARVSQELGKSQASVLRSIEERSIAARNAQDRLARTLDKELASYSDDLLYQAGRAIESVLPQEQWNALDEAYRARDAAGVAYDDIIKKAAASRARLGEKVYESFHAQTFDEMISEAAAARSDASDGIVGVLRRVDPDAVGRTLVGNGVAPEEAQRFTQTTYPRIQSLLDDLHAARREARVPQNDLLGGALEELGLSPSTGYTPHSLVRGEVATPRGNPLVDAGLLPAGESAAVAGKPSANQAALQEVLDAANARARDAAAVDARGVEVAPPTHDELVTSPPRGSSQFSGGAVRADNAQPLRAGGFTLEDFVMGGDTGRAANMNIRETLAGKVRGDTQALADAQMYDSITRTFGREIPMAQDAVTGAWSPAREVARGREAVRVVRDGVPHTYEVPTAVMQTVRDFNAGFTTDEGVKGFFRAFDKTQGVWKKLATRYNVVQYNARNALWNAWMMWTKGGLDPETYAAAKMIAMGRDIGTISLGGVDYTADTIRDLALRSRGMEGQFFKSEAGRQGAVKGIFGRVDEGVAGVANYVEDSDRLGMFMAGLKRGMAPEAAGKWTQDALLDFAPEMKTAFERNFMQRIIPFYTWVSRNTVNMGKVLAKTPGKMTWLGHAKQGGLAVNPINATLMPEYLNENFAIPTPARDAGGNTVMWIPNAPPVDINRLNPEPRNILTSITPLVRTLLEVLSNEDYYFGNEIASFPGQKKRAPGYIESFDDLVASTPFAKPWAGIKAQLGIIEKTDGRTGEPYLAMDAVALKVIRDLNPFLNNVGKFMDNQPRSPYDRVTSLTGVKMTPFDESSLEYQKTYADFAAIQDAIAALKQDGKWASRKKIAKPKKVKATSLSLVLKSKKAKKSKGLTLGAKP